LNHHISSSSVSVGVSKKESWARYEEYGGCRKTVMLFSARNLCTDKAE
jgi:hypothetical protein